jgi:two-component system, chemotaxis family, response regulator Rcp1
MCVTNLEEVVLIMNERSPKEILLVEDNALDVRITLEALSECPAANHVNVVNDGFEALEFLRRAGRHARAPRPDLILLDLNLPGKNGQEILSEIKADENLRRIPVVVLSTSQAPEDIGNAYDLHANSYVTKPAELELFTSAVKSIHEFWLSTARLPLAS